MVKIGSSYSTPSKGVALGGIITLANILFLYIASILPTNNLLFFFLSTYLPSIIVVELGIRWAITSYLATSILAILFIPNKIILILYLLFFGYYSVVKYIIEKINIFILEWGLKLASYNITMALSYLLINKLLYGSFKDKPPIWLILLIGYILFIIYDYIFSLFIGYYLNKVRK